MSDSSPQLHGPGGLLSTPGLGVRRRKARKWGMRLKDKQIIGNLYRSNTGKFTAGGQPSDAPPRFGKAPKKPKKGRAPRKPRATDAQRQEARSAKRQANSAAVVKRMAESDTGLSPSGSAALTAFASGTQPAPEVGSQLAQMGLAEQATDGSYRMTETGRAVAGAMAAGDYQRAVDGISRATDQAGKRTQQQTERTARQQETAAKRTATEATRAARREQVAQRRAEAAAKKPGKGGGSKKPAEAVAKPVAKKPAPKRSARMPSGGGSSSSSAPAKPKPSAPKPTTAGNRGAVRQAMAEADQGLAPGGFDNLMALGSGKEPDSTGANGLISMGMAERGSDGTLRLTSGGRQAIAAADRGDAKAAIDAISRASEPKKAKSFIVYKDHAGTHRWLARTTTSYRDRDNEIISSDALDQDSQRMTAAKSFGPLRYWHVGQPDPFDVANPAGPGLDIGDCDYSALIGRTRIEGGTFRDSAIAQKIAVRADQYELSPGFFHPLDQPDASGVFNAIHTFERSIVPVKYGRASNLFTGLAVKEHRMDVNEMERRFKAAITDLGLDAAQASALGQQLVQTEKDATAQGIAFKSDEAPEYPDMEINGVVYKAFPPKAAAADAQMDMGAPDAESVTEDATEITEEPADEMSGDYIGDMSWDEFAAKLSELLAPVLKMQDMHKGMTDALGEMKTMYGGQVTKDAGTQAEIASLKARLAEIEGDQPATILPDDVAEALKSAGPAQPAEPEKKQIVSTPDRPWAGWGVQTFPELYQNGEST